MGGDDSHSQEQRRRRRRLGAVWKLKVCVRANRFSLKLNLRSWKLHRLSFSLRFRNHHLKVDSQSKHDCVRFLRRLAIFRRRRRGEVDTKHLMALVRNRAVLMAKKARGAGALTLVIIILFNYLMPWTKLSTESFQLGYALFGIN
ncbi:uncharacterized protein LOC17874461 [Capsella rubella]|nr:uncharacterized protein LOC17874461 [Capsella rubella]